MNRRAPAAFPRAWTAPLRCRPQAGQLFRILDGLADHLQPLAGYRRVGQADRAGVSLGPAVHEAFLLLDVLERLAAPPPVVDGLPLADLLLVLTHRTPSATSPALPASVRP